MFLWGYFGFAVSAIILWLITIRVTRNEEGLDWLDCAGWVAGSYVGAFAVRGLGYLLHLPEVVTLVLAIIAGLTVLDWFLRGQYGQENATKIIAIFIAIRILFALPWIIVWFLSLKDVNP